MRYLAQFLVPALIILTVVYLLARTKRGQDESEEGAPTSDTGTFITILVVGAAVAVAAFFVMGAILSG